MVKFFFSSDTGKMRFSEWLKKYRKEAGLSQKGLSDKVTALGFQITDTQISNYEREYDKDREGNPTRPKEMFVELAAQVLNRPINEARSAAGYSSAGEAAINDDTAGLFRGLDKLSPEKQRIAKKQIRAIIDAMQEDEDFDFNYIED